MERKVNNSWQGRGKIAWKPEVKEVGEKAFTEFRLLCERRRPNKDGKWLKDFIKIVAWGKRAEYIAANYDQHDLVFVEGPIKTHIRVDRAGQKRTEMEVDCEYIGLIKKADIKENTVQVADKEAVE